MAMKNLANCAKVLERAQQTCHLGGSTGKKTEDAIKVSLNKLHITAQQSYPVAAILPLPANIDPTETTRFSPERNRDISAHAILTHQQQSASFEKPLDITVDSTTAAGLDPHIESYDCRGAVNLNSSMQSNVPSPFGGMHKFTHLNMPGGQWSQDSKFMSHNLQSSHYMNLRREARAGWSDYDVNATLNNEQQQQQKGMMQSVSVLLLCSSKQTIFENNRKLYNLHALTRHFSSSNDKKTNVNKINDETATKTTANTAAVDSHSNTIESKTVTDDSKLSRQEKLKRAFKEYGTTIIVFHVGISLASLGACYLLVDRGIDVLPLLEAIGLGSSTLSNKIATGASTFVIAYAIHKVFAPVRISITLGAAPFIVRYLRSKGILKVKTSS